MKRISKVNNVLLTKVILVCVWMYFYIKWMIPYNKAKLSMAYNLYMNTTMYKEREINFGKEFAFSLFVENGEHRFFLKKLTFLDKIKAAIIPFSYIGLKEEKQ